MSKEQNENPIQIYFKDLFNKVSNLLLVVVVILMLLIHLADNELVINKKSFHFGEYQQEFKSL